MVRAKVLIRQGADAPVVEDDNLIRYLDAMRKSALDWRMIFYGGALLQR
jgi:hypothetical protein